MTPSFCEIHLIGPWIYIRYTSGELARIPYERAEAIMAKQFMAPTQETDVITWLGTHAAATNDDLHAEIVLLPFSRKIDMYKVLTVKFDNGEVYHIPHEALVDLMTQEHRPPDDDDDLIDYLQNNTNWTELQHLAELVYVDPNCAYDYDEEWPNIDPRIETIKPRAETPMKLINLTPHEIVIVLDKDVELKIPPSGDIARVDVESTGVPPLYLEDGTIIPVVKTRLKEVIGLPPEKPGTAYIVSMVVAKEVKNTRYDVFYPGEFVRDDAGKILGCLGLSC